MGKRQIGVMVQWFPNPQHAEKRIAELERAGYVVSDRYPDRVWMALPDVEPEPDPEDEAMRAWMDVVAQGILATSLAGAAALFVLACFGGAT